MSAEGESGGAESIRFRLIVEADGGEVHRETLGHAALRGRVCGFEQSGRAINGWLAFSSDHEVRTEIARRHDLSERTLDSLAEDRSRRVRSALLWSNEFRNWVKKERLICWIHEGPELAESIAESLGELSCIGHDELAELLSKHPEPSVRKAMASSWKTPKGCLRILAEDVDAGVALSALESLSS